jgi:hypothetical protein
MLWIHLLSHDEVTAHDHVRCDEIVNIFIVAYDSEEVSMSTIHIFVRCVVIVFDVLD